jgi:hypothetical protein
MVLISVHSYIISTKKMKFTIGINVSCTQIRKAHFANVSIIVKVKCTELIIYCNVFYDWEILN